MRYASISVGIVDYEAAHYRESSMRLRYASGDAVAFHRYIEHAFPCPAGGHDHTLINDRAATNAGVTAAFAQLGKSGQCDVFILYLSGHGEAGAGDGGWFCLADAAPGICSLGGALLDSLLSRVDARQVLVLLDCCYAEAVFKQATYFSQLGTARTRLLIASARASQRAWEDATLERSIFSDVLLRACSNESKVQDADGMIDVETSLIPYVRDQVVLLTAKNKQGQVQEPVSGGLSAMPVTLRSVRSQSFGRSLSLAQTLRARLRRVLVGIVGTALVAFILVHAMTYHLVAGSNGQILVRVGLSSTAALLPPFLVPQVDTGFTVADIDPAKTGFLSRLSRGAVWGIASRRVEFNLKGWIGELAPVLKRSSRASYVALVAGLAAKFDPDWDAAPFDEALFLQARNANVALQIAPLYPVSPRDIPSCTNPEDRLDFSWLDPSTKVAVDDSLWWAMRTPHATAEQLQAAEALIASAAYRRFHIKDKAAAVNELIGLAHAISILASQASPQTIAALQTHVRAMLPTQCRLHASLALGLITTASSGMDAEALLRDEIHGYDNKVTGDVATIDQEIAAAALRVLGARRPLNSTTVDAIADIVRKDRGEIGGGTLPHTLLLDIAENQALPSSILMLLEERLRKSHDGVSFEDVGVARVLARNARFLGPARQAGLVALLAKLAPSSKLTSQFHEALGFAASASPPARAHIDMLVDRLSPETLFPVTDITYRGGMLISSNGDAAAVALGRIAQHHPVNADLQERLARLAIARPDLPSRQELIYGLAHQWYAGGRIEADKVYHRLMSGSADAQQRAVEIEVACVALSESDAATRARVRAKLLEHWGQESAPELRHALAVTVARALYPSVARMGMCEQR